MIEVEGMPVKDVPSSSIDLFHGIWLSLIMFGILNAKLLCKHSLHARMKAIPECGIPFGCRNAFIV